MAQVKTLMSDDPAAAAAWTERFERHVRAILADRPYTLMDEWAAEKAANGEPNQRVWLAMVQAYHEGPEGACKRGL